MENMNINIMMEIIILKPTFYQKFILPKNTILKLLKMIENITINTTIRINIFSINTENITRNITMKKNIILKKKKDINITKKDKSGKHKKDEDKD